MSFNNLQKLSKSLALDAPEVGTMSARKHTEHGRNAGVATINGLTFKALKPQDREAVTQRTVRFASGTWDRDTVCQSCEPERGVIDFRARA